ncbi:MAG: branched-chain amino acid ABC transporter substrate-binding protein [Vulcanimicrobiaceae bacterium]
MQQKMRLSRRRFVPVAIGVLALFSFGVSASVAAPKTTIKLGFIGPISGGNALQGLGAANSFRLAIQQANASGYPYKVEGVVLDDASTPTTGVNATLKLVNDPQVVAATGFWNSPVALAAMPIFQRNGIPLIVWGAVSPKITEENLSMITRDTPTLSQENEPLADWLVRGLGYKRIAILTTTDDYGIGDKDAFTKFATADGATIVSAIALPTDTTNFKPALSKIASLHPDAVYFGGVIAPAALVRKQMKSIGFDVPLAGISGIYDPKYIDIAGSAADGTLATEPKVIDNPRLNAFNRAYADAHFKDPAGPYGKYAYDATNILLKVIKEHGPKDRQALAKAIRDIHYGGVLGTTVFDGHGQTKIPITTDHYTVKNGHWIVYSGK